MRCIHCGGELVWRRAFAEVSGWQALGRFTCPARGNGPGRFDRLPHEPAPFPDMSNRIAVEVWLDA